jgi:tRNA (adenine57-N1/adenine58-N1)-methyltransferase
MVSQVERSVRAMRTAGFIDVRSLELLERAWKVGERGSRPETNMLAHTGFLTFARKP